MTNVCVDRKNGNEKASKGLKVWLLEKIKTWVNGLLEAEMTEHLQGKRYEPLATASGNCRNGHRLGKLNLFGLGCAVHTSGHSPAGSQRGGRLSGDLPRYENLETTSMQVEVAPCGESTALCNRQYTRTARAHR